MAHVERQESQNKCKCEARGVAQRSWEEDKEFLSNTMAKW